MEQQEEKSDGKDAVVASGAAVIAPDVVEQPAPAPSAPKVPKKGVYVLQEGDTPGVVSQKLFGRGNMAVPLVRANMDVVWDVGSEITIP